MNTHEERTQKNEGQSIANGVFQKRSDGAPTFQFAGNQSQRHLQEMANNGPHVMQLKAFQEMANNSPQAKQITQFQAMLGSHAGQQQTIQKKENNTGLPDNLKSGIENLSGYSMDDVKVHYNSDKPAQLHAHAYAQGTDIHLASGQEKHLAHEAWHVVQQKQGRVKPTMQMKGMVNVNNDAGFEREADVMGAKAWSVGTTQRPSLSHTLETLNASKAVQFKRVDVVALGITHIVKLNDEGSLYQPNFIDNEVGETRAGESIVIETDNKILSRRGANQELDPQRDEGNDRDQLWVNALSLNDDVLPSHSYIRNGTFTDRHQPKNVVNLASGTDPETLMSPHAEGQSVVNIDTGHMAIADTVFAHFNGGVLNIIVDLLMRQNPKGQFTVGRKTTLEDKRAAVLAQMKAKPQTTGLTNIKLLLHTCYPGIQGAMAFIRLMPREIQEEINKKLHALEYFRQGDLETGESMAQAMGTQDVVHMVNAFGFDPVEDLVQVTHLANMLAQGGRLVITAETTGPSVRALVGGADREGALHQVMTVLPNTPLGRFFYVQNVTFANRSQVMPQNAFTAGLSTRHTMPSDDTTEMEDAPTVQITFIRNDVPVERE